MPDAPKWSVLELLNWTTDFFQSAGNESPRLDAEVLLAEALGCRRIDLYTRFDEVPPVATRDAFKALVKQRGEGAPVAYLVGSREFYSLELHVERGVLIPRPETELLVVKALDAINEADRDVIVADVGCGTGAIAVAIAHQAERAKVVAIDQNPSAVELTRKNAERHGVAERVHAMQGDLFSRVKADRRFDLIVSNPPYVTTNELIDLDPTVRDHEPHEALDGGPDGCDVIRRLLAAAPDRLAPGGELLVEVSPTIVGLVSELVERTPGLTAGAVLKDLAGLPRVVTATAG
ncbi:MAG: peptide chain release factor N(5)-glutamine methyltransferase [Planctomycetota bacterium]